MKLGTLAMVVLNLAVSKENSTSVGRFSKLTAVAELLFSLNNFAAEGGHASDDCWKMKLLRS